MRSRVKHFTNPQVNTLFQNFESQQGFKSISKTVKGKLRTSFESTPCIVVHVFSTQSGQLAALCDLFANAGVMNYSHYLYDFSDSNSAASTSKLIETIFELWKEKDS